MKNTELADEIRAHGAGIELATCQNCQAAKSMDEFHRITNFSLSAQLDQYRDENAEIKAHRSWYRLVLFAASFVIFLLLASDANWFGMGKP